MATAQYVILTSRLFRTKPCKRFNLIKTRVVFFPFVSKIESNPDPGKRLYFVCRSRKKSVHKIVCAQRMVHRHNKIVGKKSSVSLPPLPPPRPLPSKIKESQNYVKQLEYELQRLESMQPNALDAVRFHRFVSWRPLPVCFFHYAFYFLWINVAWGQLKCRLDKLDSLNALECFAINY